MSRANTTSISLDKDAELFREAVNYTSAGTSFAARLIEKDYFCSVLLDYLASSTEALVFRGGTCLAKVHAGFFRLSEDLDFVIPMPIDSRRPDRRARANDVRKVLDALPDQIPAYRVVDPWTGANNSTQYLTVLAYTSLLNQQQENIKIEVSLREPLLMPVYHAYAQTILLDPISGSPLVNPVAVPCLAMREAYAEKYRAALTRRDVAIRDFYDVDHASLRLGILPDDAQLVEFVRQKLAVPGSGAVDISRIRLEELRQQVESELKPVLRDKDFAEFELERAWEVVTRMAAQVTPQGDA